jgi:hypothetical protein
MAHSRQPSVAKRFEIEEEKKGTGRRNLHLQLVTCSIDGRKSRQGKKDRLTPANDSLNKENTRSQI